MIRAWDVGALERLLAEHGELATARFVDPACRDERTALHVLTDWPGHFPNGRAVVAALNVIWQGLRDEWACHGADSVIGTFLGEREAKQEIAALELIGGDDQVILHASGGDIVAIEDVRLPDGIYNVFTLDAGTIARIDDYADRHDALAAAGLSEPTARAY